MEQVSEDRSNLGAIQNRLESTLNNVANITENLSASKSRILDADFALESSNMSRQSVLQQAATSDSCTSESTGSGSTIIAPVTKEH